VQGDKITTLTTAAKVEVEPIWASLLAKALDGKDIKELLTNVGGGGAPAAAGVAAAGGAAAGGAAEAAPAEEKKEEAKEESDDDMVGLRWSTSAVVCELTCRASVSSTKLLALTGRWFQKRLLRLHWILHA
jgi:large subunit ribosomal protein LP1